MPKLESSMVCLKQKVAAKLWDELPWEFSWEWHDYTRCNGLKNALNSMLGVNAKAVYTSGGKTDFSGKSIDWSGVRILIIRECGKIVEMHNSEWAFFEVVK